MDIEQIFKVIAQAKVAAVVCHRNLYSHIRRRINCPAKAEPCCDLECQGGPRVLFMCLCPPTLRRLCILRIHGLCCRGWWRWWLRCLLCREVVSWNGHRLWPEITCCQCPLQAVEVRPCHSMSPLQCLAEACIVFFLEQAQEGGQEDWLAA